MADDGSSAKNDPIIAPTTDPKRELGRTFVEVIASTNPITGGLARLYQVTHPSKSTRDREEWQRAISERTNEHGKRLDRHWALLSPPAETLAGLSARLVEFLARACPDGLAEHFHDLDEVLAALPGTTADELREAAEDLVSFELVDKRSLIGADRLRPTQRFYEQFDHQVMVEWGSEGTRRDAAKVASLILETGESQSPELLALTGWPLRRFNPALAHLKNEHPDWGWRDQSGSDFPSLGLLIGPKEKMGLRRFTGAVEREGST
ncbi:hypothetical protein LRP31_33440 (plasmid) [Mesorhizobium mediterraneum]|uniref:Uncharacterized protein n=1 Tax=Mesorhizobium mediterraneum TaxID=43617 RepID=A0AB36R1Z5_9HYPH|nr:hypothetical protein [Mesorhizobium mediterraneum]PAP98617.1 hypothetical protein CIT25_29405 [Mesorhizobium mediterraneum]WIW57043.1 hypothetical protein LRP31_33440 [Mesorhizobium mediterraneum]